MTRSEFGRGCIYCIGLFLAHEGRYQRDIEVYTQIGSPERAPQMWFYGAADHLFEMEIPKDLSAYAKNRLAKFRKRVLELRNPMLDEPQPTEQDVMECIQEAKDLLRYFDKNILKMTTVKGDHE